MKYVKQTMLIALLAFSIIGTASAVTINSVDDIDVDGMLVGVQSGTTSDLYAADNFKNAEIKAYDSILLAEEALEVGDVHVLMGDKPVLDLYAADNEEYAVLASFSEELFGLGVAEGQPDLLNALNAALTEIFADTGAHGYDAIYAQWFSDIPAVYDDGDGNYPYPATESLAANGLLKHIIDTGEIDFGTDPTYPPFEEKQTDGSYEGFDIDMMDEIASRLSAHYNTTVNVAISDSDWDPIITNLQNGEFDVILSAMTKTADRDQQIDFTRAYYGSIQGVLGPADGVVDLEESSDGGILPMPILPMFIGLSAMMAIVYRRK